MEEARILIGDLNGDDAQPQILKPHEAKKMLGVFLAMESNNATQIKHMRKVVNEWYEYFRVGHLSRFDTWTAFTIAIMRILEYPLLALTLIESNCTYIMAPVLSGVLSDMGICRTMARTLMYAPLKHHGICINKLYTSHGLVHVNEGMSHVCIRTETGYILRTSMDHVKLGLGIRGSLFKHDYNI